MLLHLDYVIINELWNLSLKLSTLIMINIADCDAGRAGEKLIFFVAMLLAGVRSDSSLKKVSDRKLRFKVRLKRCLPRMILCQGESKNSLLRPEIPDGIRRGVVTRLEAHHKEVTFPAITFTPA